MTERTVILKDGDIGHLLNGLDAVIAQTRAMPEAMFAEMLQLSAAIGEVVDMPPLYSCKADYLDSLADLKKRLVAQPIPLPKKAP
jgi:hypothetical protein